MLSVSAYFVSVIGWEPLNTLAIAPTIYAPHFLFCGQVTLYLRGGGGGGRGGFTLIFL